MPRKSPALLKLEQRELFMLIPEDLSDRDIAHYYTLSTQDLALIKKFRGSRNRIGFAVQLCVLRFPGRTLTEISHIPDRILSYIAEQVGVDVESFADYGQRGMTLYEHLHKIRDHYGYRHYGWSEMLFVAR